MTLFALKKKQKKGRPPRETLVLGSIPWIVSALVAGLIPHIPAIPLWIPLWCFLLWGYSIAAEVKGLPMPRPITRFFLTLLGIACVLISSAGIVDNAFGASLLCTMAGLKPLEIRNERDLFISIFIAYFMVVSSLFFSASLMMTLYMVTAMIHITAVLIRVNTPASTINEALKIASAITAKAIPLTLVLFFFFPRIDGNLFGITPRKSATSGFSNTLSPGSVSQLARSNVPVFRVSFDSEIPAPEKRYFRGIVFQEFDGRSWRASATPPGIKGTVKVRGNLTYRIHFETRQVDRLFPMDLPLKLPAGTVLRGDFTAKAPKEGIKDSPYTFRSSLAYNTGEMQPWEVIFLHLPEGGNPRSRALAMDWRRTLITPEKIIETALNRFRNTDFRYTLSPPPLKGDPVDAFLFKTQKGYCEHFASSFTYLMRAAGIPARVVGGYLGGSVNPFGEYLIVRQSDAHAWCEVWLKGKGWTRIDPTSVVAPARLEQGAGFALPEVERPSFFITGSSSLFSRTLHRIRLGWDSINYQWDAKVIGYSFSLQTTFLKKLGITTTGWKGLLKAAFWVFGLLGIILAAGWLLMEFKGREKHSHVQTSWLIFQSKMAKSGLAKEKSQGPLDFLAAIQKKRPALASDAARITQLYVQLAYGKRAGDQKVEKRLRKKVRRFKVHRPAKKPI